MPALRSEANITSDVWLCSAQPPWGMRPYGYLVSSCMPGHCLNCEKVASATQSQYGSTRDKCWDVSLNILVLCCLQGRSWLGHRLMVTLELLSEHPLQTDLGLSFPNGRKGLRVLDGYLPEKRSFLSHFRMAVQAGGLASTGTNGVLSLISEWQGEVTRSGKLPG